MASLFLASPGTPTILPGVLVGSLIDVACALVGYTGAKTYNKGRVTVFFGLQASGGRERESDRMKEGQDREAMARREAGRHDGRD